MNHALLQYAGCHELCQKMRHPFSRTYVDESGCPFTCWKSNGKGLIFGKKCKFLVLVMVRPRYRPSLVFRLSLVCSKFTFSAGMQLFGLITTSHGKPDQGIPVPQLHPEPHCVSNLMSKKKILGQVYHMKWFSSQKVEYLRRTWTCCKPGWAWKPGWACTWSWPWPKKKKFKLIFQVWFTLWGGFQAKKLNTRRELEL